MRPCGGFTIIELLICIGLIGVLLALLVPAVQGAREATRRVQCSNHLKQLALGCLQHESAHGFLPTGGWNWRWQGDPDRGFGRAQPGGWTYNVLPFIEQLELHQMGSGKSIADKKKDFAKVAQTPVSLFYCPTRRAAILYPVNEINCNSDSIQSGARTDYAGNSGTLPVTWYLPPTTGDPKFFDQPGYQCPNFDRKYDGVMAPMSVISLDALIDSPTYTILLGEKFLLSNSLSGLEASDNNAIYTGFDWDWQRWGHNAPRRDRTGPSDHTSFGSSHPAGTNVAMCDGAVRTISYDIADDVFAKLCGRANGAASLKDD